MAIRIKRNPIVRKKAKKRKPKTKTKTKRKPKKAPRKKIVKKKTSVKKKKPKVVNKKKKCRKRVIHETMGKYKRKTLKFSKGKKKPSGYSVRSRKQALAIALSSANRKC